MKKILVSLFFIQLFIMFSCADGLTNVNETTNTLADLDDNLIGYWNFENDSLLDLSKNQNNGIVLGNVSFTEGKKGNAINFIGCPGYAKIPYDSVFSTSEKTISFWMYKNNDYILESPGKVDAEGIIGKAYDTGTKRDFTIAISGNNPRFHIYGSVGTEDDSLITDGKVKSILPNIWYHCVFVIGKDFSEFYLNGIRTEHSKKEADCINSSAPIFIGKDCASTICTRYFNGKVDELRIYNRALDKNEIQLLYYDAL